MGSGRVRVVTPDTREAHPNDIGTSPGNRMKSDCFDQRETSRVPQRRSRRPLISRATPVGATEAITESAPGTAIWFPNRQSDDVRTATVAGRRAGDAPAGGAGVHRRFRRSTGLQPAEPPFIVARRSIVGGGGTPEAIHEVVRHV